MKRFRDAEHLLRLAVVFVVGIVAFFIVRAILVPRSFGEYGPYRGDAIAEIAARPVAFAGHESCEACRSDVAGLKSKGSHQGVNCEACHGALAKHADDPSLVPSKLDLVHRIYEADESFRSLDFMVHTRLYVSQVVIQIYLGTLLPIGLLALTQVLKFGEKARKRIYAASASLTLVGIFAMRWNVVIGGQLFSKSFLGYTTYKIGFVTKEGLLTSVVLMLLPLAILWVLVKLLPPWPERRPARESQAVAAGDD